MCTLCRKGIRALVLMAVVALPRTAGAEPIAITSGHLETQVLLGLANLVFQGDGFLLDAGVDGFRTSLAFGCTPCAPGTTVDLGGAFDLPRGQGTAVVDGVAYSQIFIDGMTGTFSSPSFQITGAGTVTVTRPFSYSGVVSGFVLDPFVHGPTEPVFTKELFGRGTATATFLFSDTEGPLFTAHDVRYDFSGTGTVPEPTTLLLCAPGSAVLAMRRRRKVQTTR
jgi:hypothetical protein